MSAPLVVLVQQRHEADCAIAALAMLLGVSYEEVLLMVSDPSVLQGGTWMTQLVEAAARFDLEMGRHWKTALIDRRGREMVVAWRFAKKPLTNAR